MDENRELERFLEAQVGDYDDALSEISAGEKQSHWIWYVFPHLKGLGMSWTSEYCGIADLAESRLEDVGVDVIDGKVVCSDSSSISLYEPEDEMEEWE